MADCNIDCQTSTGSKSCALVPQTFTSFCHNNNKGAIDWGWHGLLAYAAQHNIVIVDTENMQQVQCLSKHKTIIKKVLWSPQNYEFCNISNVSLVSADMNGCIIFWDIDDGKVVSVMQDGNKSILSIEWVPIMDKSKLYLAALHSPYSFTIWNVVLGSKVWKKSFTDILTNFCFDPFDPTKLAFLCPDCILFVDEFSVLKAPSTNGRKFYISSPRLAEDNMRTRDRLKKLMLGLVVGENKPKPEDTMTISECLQLTYHRSLRNHILLLYSKDILLIDLHINMTVGVISVDKSASPLIQIISCSQRDVLYCFHESGSISVRVRRRSNSTFLMSSPFDTPMDPNNKFEVLGPSFTEKFVWYDLRCQSDPMRLVKGTKMLSMAVHPITQKHLALTINTGKVVFLELDKVKYSMIPSDQNENEDLMLSNILPSSTYESAPLTTLRLITYGIFCGYPWAITVIRMCPFDSHRVSSFIGDHSRLLAIGTAIGHLLLFNMANGTVHREYSIHNNAVRGIEWCGFTKVISWAQIDLSGNKVKNELFITDVITGQSHQLRENVSAESPIEFIRISPMKQYFIIVKKDGKLELWNMKKLAILRSMPDKFPSVKALEWSPVYSTKSHGRKKSEDNELDPNKRRLSSASASADESSLRENLVFCDGESTLYHFSVENNTFHDGIKIPPESLVAPVTSLAFKSNKIVQADIEGLLNIWDLKAQVSRTVHTGRNCISKIRFSPGKGNLKLLILYIDGGIDLYDLKQSPSERIAQLRCPKDITKILDIDWASAQIPVLITEDGCILLTNVNFNEYFSPIHRDSLEAPLSCVALIPNSAISVIHAWCSLQESMDKRNNILHTTSFTEVVCHQLSLLRLYKLDLCTFGIAERSLQMAIILGNLDDIRFWTVALYYLQAGDIDAKCSKSDIDNVPSIPFTSIEHSCGKKFVNFYPTLQPLDTSYDFLCDSYTYQKIQLEQVELHEWKRGDYQHTQRVIERLILLGEIDRAVQLLLETDFSNSNYYTDSIKACLVAAIQTTGTAQSTIKLVATNFIANGKIWEGVQLLCLIGKRVDACRYLISCGLWGSAVWLAKSTLPAHEAVDVMKKWVHYLKSTGDWSNAILVLISQLQFESALELLVERDCYQKAVLLLEACQEFKLPVSKDLASTIRKNFDALIETYNLKTE